MLFKRVVSKCGTLVEVMQGDFKGHFLFASVFYTALLQNKIYLATLQAMTAINKH